MSTFAIAGGDIAPVEPVVETPYVEESTSAFYLGLGYSGMNVDLSSDIARGIEGESDSFNQVLLQAGYKFNDYVALEGRYAIGTDDSTWNWYDAANPLRTQTVSADSWNIFVKPMYPVSDAFDVYALLGYGETSFDWAYGSTNFGDVGGFAWGLGAAYNFSDNVAVFVDYVDQEDGDFNGAVIGSDNNFDLSFETWSVGVTYTF